MPSNEPDWMLPDGQETWDMWDVKNGWDELMDLFNDQDPAGPEWNEDQNNSGAAGTGPDDGDDDDDEDEDVDKPTVGTGNVSTGTPDLDTGDDPNSKSIGG